MNNNRVEVPIELSEEEELILFRAAHEKDITLNQYVEQILLELINEKIGKKQLNLFGDDND